MSTSDKKPNGAEPPRRLASRRARGLELTERDLEILRWIARHGVVTTEMVGHRFFWRDDAERYGSSAAYRRLRKMREAGLIQRNRTAITDRDVIRVTREGARFADVGLRPAKLVLSELRHTLALVELTEFLLQQNNGAELTTERELRAQHYRERNEGARHPESGRTPDALLRLRVKSKTAETVAIELDLSRKDRRAMEQMVRQYDREPVDRIWWYVTKSRTQRIKAFVREMKAEDRIKVVEWLG